jgi:hypothetical protein
MKEPGRVYDKWNISVFFVTQIFHSGQPTHGGDRNVFEVLTSTLPRGTLGSVGSLLVVTLYHGNPDRNHKVWNIVSTEIYILHMQVLLEYCYIKMEFTIGKFKSSLLS